jgi:hypothetical protein
MVDPRLKVWSSDERRVFGPSFPSEFLIIEMTPIGFVGMIKRLIFTMEFDLFTKRWPEAPQEIDLEFGPGH